MSSKYTKFARGRECQIRIPGYCTHNPEQSVPCHLNGGGMGLKMPDILNAIGCSVCHDIVDFRKPIKEFSRDEIKIMHHEGIFRTIIMMNEENLFQ